MLQDFAENLPNAESYAVAISDSLVCLSAIGFEEEIENDEVMSYFIGAESEDLNIPEIFEEVQLTDEFVAVVHNGSSYIFLSIEDTTSSSVQVTDSILLELLYVYCYFDESSALTGYYGESLIGEETYSFEIESSYYRQENTDFTVMIEVNGTQDVLEFTDLVVEDAGCSDVTPPRGISSFNDYPVQYLSLDYSYDEDSVAMVLTFQKFEFEAYNYAVAPYVYLYDVEGFIVVESSTYECGYETIGFWDYEDYELKLTVFDRNSTGDMEASGVFLNIEKISISEVDEYFYQLLFPENSTLFPTFNPEDPTVIRDFRTLDISSPLIELYFLPDTGFNIYGTNSTFQVEVIANRVNGTVETVVHSFTFTNESYDIGYEVIEQGVYYASNDVDLASYYSMSSFFDSNRANWTSGIWLDVEVKFNDQCSDNEYCEVLQRQSGQEDLLLVHGYMLDDVVYVDYPLNDFDLASGISIEEAGLAIEYSASPSVPTIVGTYYLRTDSHTVLRVETEIVQGEDLTALALGESYQVWAQALDVSYINVVTIFVNVTVLPDGTINSTVCKADSIVGDNCYNGKTFKSKCLVGTIDVFLDVENYLYNSFNLFLYNLTSLEFYNTLVGYSFGSSDEIYLPYSALTLETGLIVEYEYAGEFYLSGGVQFAGVYADLSGVIKTLGQGDLDCSFTLEDFYFAESNGRMSNPKAELVLDRLTDYSKSSISGTLHMWDVEVESSFALSNKFSLDFSGFIYDGSYNYSIHLEADDSPHVTEASFAGKISLVESTVQDSEKMLRSDLNSWLSLGLEALDYLDSTQNSKLAELEKYEDDTCDPEVTCPTSVYCKDQVDTVCDRRKIIESCQAESSLGCNNVELVCIDSSEICIKNSSCSGSCPCISTVTVCKEWKSQCNENSDSCTDTYLQKDPENCEKTKLSCQTEEISNKACKYQCEYLNEIYSIGQEQYKTFESGYNRSYDEMVGYLELNDLLSSKEELKELIRLQEIYAEKSITESGVGPYDFEFKSASQIISIESSDYETYELNFYWDFFNPDLNNQTLINTTRSAVIDLSSGTLNSTLSWKSPYELISENIYN